jgi:hypothetical protein
VPLFSTWFTRRTRVTLETLNTKLDGIERLLVMTAAQLQTRLAALEQSQEEILKFGTEAFEELTREIALLREQLANVELPAAVEATLGRLEVKSAAGLAKSKELADVIQQAPPPPPPPVEPVDPPAPPVV